MRPCVTTHNCKVRSCLEVKCATLSQASQAYSCQEGTQQHYLHHMQHVPFSGVGQQETLHHQGPEEPRQVFHRGDVYIICALQYVPCM